MSAGAAPSCSSLPDQRRLLHMSRDDPSVRFEVSVQTPAFAMLPLDDGAALLSLAGPTDRVLARETEGEGITSFELVPSGCGWSEDPRDNPVTVAASQAAVALNMGIALRIERGISTGTGLWDFAPVVAAVAAVEALRGRSICAQTAVKGVCAAQVDAVLQGQSEHAPRWPANALLFVDTKATADDHQAALQIARDAGAIQTLLLPPSTIVVGCVDTATATAIKNAMIETLAMRGVWSRGRAGQRVGRRLQVQYLHQVPDGASSLT